MYVAILKKKLLSMWYLLYVVLVTLNYGGQFEEVTQIMA